MRTIAPAKVNWTLEVLGRRQDGYHEIRSVMQTIDLCDELSAELSDSPVFETAKGEPLADDDLIVRAARALEGGVGRALPVRIRVTKRIPVASGLGGGSSDAAAVLRLLNRLHQLELSDEELATVGAAVGSDVPFFVYGGTALVEGRGERVTPLPDVPQAWLVVLVPPSSVPEKTRKMYEAIKPFDYADGRRSMEFIKRAGAREPVNMASLYNSFDDSNQGASPATSVFAQLKPYKAALMKAGASGVCLAGAGPALFSVAAYQRQARNISRELRPDLRVCVARTITAAEATAIVE